ncbi:MAG: hypothetical protein JWM44_2497 [Bacilli bacterium]|nr:hypothetical protein [Bacilli bacterium]
MPLSFRITSYARNIYIFGTTSFSLIDPAYVNPVKVYAATGVANGVHSPADFNGYSDAELNNALAQGWITQQEYDDTIALR